MSKISYSSENKKQENNSEYFSKRSNFSRKEIDDQVAFLKLLINGGKKNFLIYDFRGYQFNGKECYRSKRSQRRKIINEQEVSDSTLKRAHIYFKDFIIYSYGTHRNPIRHIVHHVAHLDHRNIPPYLKKELRIRKEKEVFEARIVFEDSISKMSKNQDVKSYDDPPLNPHSILNLEPSLGIRKQPVQNPTFIYNSVVSTKTYVSKDGVSKEFIIHASTKELDFDRKNYLKRNLGKLLPENEYYTFDFPLNVLVIAGEKYHARCRPEIVRIRGEIENPVRYYMTLCKSVYKKQINL